MAEQNVIKRDASENQGTLPCCKRRFEKFGSNLLVTDRKMSNFLKKNSRRQKTIKIESAAEADGSFKSLPVVVFDFPSPKAPSLSHAVSALNGPVTEVRSILVTLHELSGRPKSHGSRAMGFVFCSVQFRIFIWVKVSLEMSLLVKLPAGWEVAAGI